MLRGAGALVGLPLLQAMSPAARAFASAAGAGAGAGAEDRPPVRMACLFWPNGCNPHTWTPKGEGKLGELSPILSSLAPVKDHVSVLTNTELQNAYPGTHSSSNAAFLSAARAKLS